ncbi:unnamed protein product [Caretta caretta]
MFSEILPASAALDHVHRAWRINIANGLEKETLERRKDQESQQMHKDIMRLLRQQTQMLKSLVDLQVQQSHAPLPLQHMKNSISGPPYNSTSNIPHGNRGRCTTPATPP